MLLCTLKSSLYTFYNQYAMDAFNLRRKSKAGLFSSDATLLERVPLRIHQNKTTALGFGMCQSVLTGSV